MFVYIVGNVEQNIFKLGTALDPFVQLKSIQAGNPYKLSVLSKIRVQSKNSAGLIENIGLKNLSKHEEAGGWLVGVPAGISTQFVDGHYLRSLASKAGVEVVQSDRSSMSSKRTYLQRLSQAAKQKGMSFQDIQEKVEQAYAEGKCIGEIL